MSNCSYTFRGHEYTSQELVDYVKNNPQDFINEIERDTYREALNDLELDEADKEDLMKSFESRQDTQGILFKNPTNTGSTTTEDNLMSYVENKKNLLARLEEKFKRFRNANRSKAGTSEYKSTYHKYQSTINRLETELSNLDTSKAENVFQNIISEIKTLSNALDTFDIHDMDTEDIMGRIDFLDKMITGNGATSKIDGSGFENYNELVLEPMVNLRVKLESEKNNIIKSAANSDILYQYNTRTMTSDEEKAALEALWNPTQKDINIFQEYFLGINSNDDTIVPTIIKNIFDTNIVEAKQGERESENKLKKLDEIIRKKKISTNIFIDRDKEGIKTGNLIHKFSNKFISKLPEYYRLVGDANSATQKDKAIKYAKRINWLQANTHVIDFRKLSYFKDKYGHLYGEHFTSSEEEMKNYEEQLKNLLGRLYQDYIDQIENNLDEYENYKFKELANDNQWTQKNIVSESPWAFIKNYTGETPTGAVHYSSGESGGYTYVNANRYIEFIPRTQVYDSVTGGTKDSEYYNSDFNKVEADDDAYEYWSTIKDMYVNHINPTYISQGQNMSDMSYAKIARSFAEEILNSKGVSGKMRASVAETIEAFRNMWYEQSSYSTNTGIKSNYTDRSVFEINKIKKALSMLSTDEVNKRAAKIGIPVESESNLISGLSSVDANQVLKNYRAEIADKIARAEVYEEYSDDLTKITLALSEMASLHKARVNTQFMAELLKNYHQDNFKNEKGEIRKKSIGKLNSWIDTNIYNNRMGSRGNPNDPLGKESQKRMWNKLSDVERKLQSILNDVKKNLNTTTDFSYNIGDKKYERRNGVTTVAEGNTVTQISKDEFENKIADYIDNELKNLGVPMTWAGFLQGIIKSMVAKTFLANPSSGFFNRTEGMFTNMIMDRSGRFWTPGNIRFARGFLTFSNLSEFTRLDPRGKSHKLQLETFKLFIDEMSLFQDRKNELDRKDKESKYNRFKEHFDLYQFAIRNPEFKNQGEIILAMLRDVIVRDKEGNEHRFFDGSGFPMYKPGTLELKEEFKTEGNEQWENFVLDRSNLENNKFFVVKSKIDDAIKKTQGNYSATDSIQAHKTTLGRLMLLFMRWMPEHVNQRFSRRGIDVIQGKTNQVGRYNALLRNTGSAGVFLGATTSLAFGLPLLPLMALPLLTQLGGAIYSKYKFQESIGDHMKDLSVTIGFFNDVVLQTLNLPVKILHLGNTPGISKLQSLNDKLYNTSRILTDQEKGALRASAKELAVMIFQLMVAIALKRAFWDDDDDKNSFKRQVYNYIDNMGNRSINSLLSWSDPKAFVDDNSKFALLRTLGDLQSFAKAIGQHGMGKKVSASSESLWYKALKLQPVVPIPNLVSKYITGMGGVITDTKEYNKNWYDDYSKSEEYHIQQQLKEARAEFKENYRQQLIQELEGQGIDTDDKEMELKVNKMVNSRMHKKDVTVNRKQGETNKQALEIFNRLNSANDGEDNDKNAQHTDEN